MKYYKYIFSIVIYRNFDDLRELLNSIQAKVKESYKVIVVNNYYDESTKIQVMNIARGYNCDFINSENRGYGAGNNAAINLAIKKYSFEYLIVSNPDIVVEKFSGIERNEEIGIVAPSIVTKNGKNQNPMNTIDCKLATRLIYHGLKCNHKMSIFIGLCINKFIRTVSTWCIKISGKDFYHIYMAHGSFVFFEKSALLKLLPLYDEKMFLFAEEAYLAWKAKENGIRTVYTSEIKVQHKEDGSMQFRDDINDQLKKSNIYFYENYYSK